jgi:hypothetical protein
MVNVSLNGEQRVARSSRAIREARLVTDATTAKLCADLKSPDFSKRGKRRAFFEKWNRI